MAKILAVCASIVALAAPAALAADPVPADFKNAAKYCKAVRDSKGVDAFQTAYGTNKNKKNAFGKCVSQTAKAKAAKREDAKKDDDDDDAAESKATADCKKLQSADAAKFAQDYKNFGQCVKVKKGSS
jgi:opacity protein-like surface antigen